MGDKEFFRQLRFQVNTLVQSPSEQTMVNHKMLIELYGRQTEARRQGRTITLQVAMDAYNRELDTQEANP